MRSKGALSRRRVNSTVKPRANFLDMNSCEIDIEVASRPEASRILSSPYQCAEVSFLVSIGAPEDELPEGYSNISRKLRLLFGDTQTAEDGATESDVRCLIELAHRLKGSAGRVLIHCEAGVSRSTAAALIMYTCLLGPGSEREAMERVLGQRPIARPNRRMVEIADHLLGRGGRLVGVLDSDGSIKGALDRFDHLVVEYVNRSSEACGNVRYIRGKVRENE